SADYALMPRFFFGPRESVHYLPRNPVKMTAGGARNGPRGNIAPASRQVFPAWRMHGSGTTPPTIATQPLSKLAQLRGWAARARPRRMAASGRGRRDPARLGLHPGAGPVLGPHTAEACRGGALRGRLRRRRPQREHTGGAAAGR